MKRVVIMFLLITLISFLAQGQTFRYSEEVGKLNYSDGVHLVANVAGYHHLLRFGDRGKPGLYIFDAHLKKIVDVEMGEDVRKNTDIKIIPFDDHYLLYMHDAGTTRHLLWRIDGNGSQTALSTQLQQVVETELLKTTATLQLARQNKDLLLISHQYYDTLEKVISKVVRLDIHLKQMSTQQVAFPFRIRSEKLQQVDVVGNTLLVLKTIRNSGEGNLLCLSTTDLNTGEAEEKVFSSGSSFFLNPAFRFSPADSSFLVYAVVKTPPGASTNQVAFFVCRLNRLLEETAHVRTFRLQISGYAQEDYFWIDGQQPEWLDIKTYLRPLQLYQQRVMFSDRSRNVDSRSAQDDDYIPLAGYGSSAKTMNVRLTLLSKQLSKLKDTVMNEVGESGEFIPFANTTFRLRNQPYVLLSLKLPRNNRSLLLISADANAGLSTVELPVYSRYEYLLASLQPVAADNAFLIPYKHKRQIGLVKVSLNKAMN